jgi:hypothetical protein
MDRIFASSFTVEYKWELYHPDIGETLFSGYAEYTFPRIEGDDSRSMDTADGDIHEKEVRIALIWTYYEGPIYIRCVNLSVQECFDNDDWHSMEMSVELYEDDRLIDEYSGQKPDDEWDYSTLPPEKESPFPF